MYGYVRPDVPELKIKDYNRFKVCYCGLCHELGKTYGLAARFILNYDFVFLTMLLSDGTSPPEYEMKRCPYAVWCRKCVCRHSDVLEKSAGYSLILAYHKLDDTERDEKLPKRLGAKLSKLMLAGSYKRAKRLYPEFDGTVSKLLSEQQELERARETSLDRMADKFASLLAGAAGTGESPKERICREILYHLGRVVYISDAYEDFSEDYEAKRYNPISEHFGVTDGIITEEITESVRFTLVSSLNMICSAYELMEKNYWDSVLSNIIYVGLHKMITDVLAGSYDPTGRELKKQMKKLTQNLQQEAN